MKKVFSLLLLVFFGFTISMAQEEKKFGIEFSGFVKTDLMWDSRQTVSIRESHFLLYPVVEVLDENGEDINKVSDFNILSIQTRLLGKISGPDALGAKTSGLIEGEFFGHSDGDINGFRLRHAFVKLSWSKTELLVGQYWHPLFTTNCFPGVVSFNTGVPFIPFARNPQVRFTHRFGDLKLSLTALSQRDFVSNGPEGPSSKYLRDAALPELNLTAEYIYKNAETGDEYSAALSGNYKKLLPFTVTSPDDKSSYKTSNMVSSMALAGYLKAKLADFTLKAGSSYGEDMFDLTMLGGYAVEKIADPQTGSYEYTPFKTISFWGDFHTNGKKWQVGLFSGFTENLGTVDEFGGKIYARGYNIDYVYRIAPRLIYNTGKFRIAPEIEYTVAAYATSNSQGIENINRKGQVYDSKEVANLRLLLGVYLFF
jgi:hypothetical protein